MKIYYKGWFGKIYEVEILAKEKYCNVTFSYPTFYYKYLIQFPNGKKKIVHEDRMIINLE